MSSIPLLLSYGKAAVRALASSEGLWFCAADLFHANRYKTDRAYLAHMSPDHLSIQAFPAENGSLKLTAVSPLGAATIAKAFPSPRHRATDAWVRRETSRLAQEHGFPPLPLSLLADNTLPVRPKATHDRYEAWKELARLHPQPTRRRWDPVQPALFDEDPSLPPHDPIGDRARFRAKYGLDEPTQLAAPSN
jgi:hypothetical protein